MRGQIHPALCVLGSETACTADDVMDIGRAIKHQNDSWTPKSHRADPASWIRFVAPHRRSEHSLSQRGPAGHGSTAMASTIENLLHIATQPLPEQARPSMHRQLWGVMVSVDCLWTESHRVRGQLDIVSVDVRQAYCSMSCDLNDVRNHPGAGQRPYLSQHGISAWETLEGTARSLETLPCRIPVRLALLQRLSTKCSRAAVPPLLQIDTALGLGTAENDPTVATSHPILLLAGTIRGDSGAESAASVASASNNKPSPAANAGGDANHNTIAGHPEILLAESTLFQHLSTPRHCPCAVLAKVGGPSLCGRLSSVLNIEPSFFENVQSCRVQDM